MILLVTIVTGQKEDLQVVEEDLPEEEVEDEMVLPIEVRTMTMEMVIVMVMMMVKKVIKVVYLAIGDPQAHRDCKDYQDPKVFNDLKDFRVIEVYKVLQVDKAFKVYVVYLGKEDPEGFRGPHGQAPAAQIGKPQLNPNITTLDTSGLETSFQAVGNAMNQLAQQQQIANAQLNQSLIQQ